MSAVAYHPFEERHLDGIIRLAQIVGWDSYADAEKVRRALTAPGVTALVAVDRGAEPEAVVGFVQMQSDGVIQAHLSALVVQPDRREQGIGRELVQQALAVAGGARVDLVTDREAADAFYASFEHRRMIGFRIYPDADPKAPDGT